jgi:hypothetical protein
VLLNSFRASSSLGRLSAKSSSAPTIAFVIVVMSVFSFWVKDLTGDSTSGKVIHQPQNKPYFVSTS